MRTPGRRKVSDIGIFWEILWVSSSFQYKNREKGGEGGDLEGRNRKKGRVAKKHIYCLWVLGKVLRNVGNIVSGNGRVVMVAVKW